MKGLISCDFPFAWPSRSPDLNLSEFKLREFLKDRVYRGSARTLLEMKVSITRHVTSVDRETLRAKVEHA